MIFQTRVAFSAFGEVNCLRHISIVLYTDKPAQASINSSNTVHIFPSRKARLDCCWVQLDDLRLCLVPLTGYGQNWGFPFPGPLKHSVAKVHMYFFKLQ